MYIVRWLGVKSKPIIKIIRRRLLHGVVIVMLAKSLLPVSTLSRISNLNMSDRKVDAIGVSTRSVVESGLVMSITLSHFPEVGLMDLRIL